MLKKGRFLFLIVAIIEIAMYFIPVSSEVFAVYKEENMLKENSIEVTNEEDDTNEIENNNSYKVANIAQNDSGELTVPEGYSKFESEETKKWNQSVNVVESAGVDFKKWMGENNSDGLFLVGHYQFNYTGGSAVPRGALGNADLYQCNQNSEYFSKLSRLEGYKWVEYFEQDKQSESVTIPGNSSAGTLTKKNTGDTIYKAYLVISQKKNKSHYHLKNCPITLIGPNKQYITTIMQHIENPNRSNRYVGYMDVTEFVKDQGYGEYICCNVPYEAGETDDQYASWRLIVIEENTTKNAKGENNLPLRALTLKLGAAYLSGASGSVSVKISKEGIKSLNTDGAGDKKITGQLFYSVDGADETNNQNVLTLDIKSDNKTETVNLYDKSGNENWNNTIRTKEQPLHYILTRNGLPIESKSKYGTVSGKNFERKYNSNYNYHGADADLIDIDGSASSPITIPSSASDFTFKFATNGGVTLQPSAIGLAVDIEGTDYETTIKTQNVKKDNYEDQNNGLNDNQILVTGSARNIRGNNGTGLYNTKTIITLDEKINNVENAQVKAFFKKSTTQVPEIALTAEEIGEEIKGTNIKANGNTIEIDWGRKESDKNIDNLTLYGDEMTFEITGLEVKDGEDVNQCTNTVEVTGKIFASGVPVDTELEMAPNESKVVYKDITIEEIWKDDGYEENRPDSVTVSIYDLNDVKSNLQGGLPGGFSGGSDESDLLGLLMQQWLSGQLNPKEQFVLTKDNADERDHNKWTKTVVLASQEQEGGETAKSYNYVIVKNYGYTAKNNDVYSSNIAVDGGKNIDLTKYYAQHHIAEDLLKNTAIVKETDDKAYFTLTTTNTLTGKRNVTVSKNWEDYNNIRDIRPDEIKVELLADGEKISEEPNKYMVTLNSENRWTTKFNDVNKYDENGKAIEYTAKEYSSEGTENIEGYVGKVEIDYNTTTEEGKNTYRNSKESTVTITNNYAENLNPEFTQTITKQANVKKTGTNSEIIYEIRFNTAIEDFIGDANIIIVDELPFEAKNIEKITEVDKNGNAISEDKLIGNELLYNSKNNTITWVVENSDIIKLLGKENKDTVINTYKNGKAEVEITKYIKVNYKDIDIKEEKIENKATGTLALKVKEDGTNISTQKEGSAEANATTELKKATLEVKYLNGETGEELATSDQKEVFVGDTYKAEAKEIEDYELVTPMPENKEGTIKEGENEVIFYYRKKTFEVNGHIVNGKITVTKGKEENDNKVNVIIHENATVEYKPEEKYYVSKIIINGKEQDTTGKEKGGIIKLEDIKENYNIVIICEKITGIVYVEYVDENGKNISNSDEVIGYLGDTYKTEAKDIEGYVYQKTEGIEEGEIQEGVIFVKYYYRKVEEIHTTGEKDDTPKTGEENSLINFVCIITMLSLAGIITLKKKM